MKIRTGKTCKPLSKILAVILSVALVFGVMTITAAAEGESGLDGVRPKLLPPSSARRSRDAAAVSRRAETEADRVFMAVRRAR